MNEKATRVLEYSKIIELLKAQAGSEMTKKIISELKPYIDIRIIEEALLETDEAVKLITYKGPLPLGNFYDIGKSIDFAQKGGALTMGQLLRVYYNMKVASNVVSYLKGDIPTVPILTGMGDVIIEFKDLADDIDRSIESEDEMSDNASRELKDIRRNIARQNEAIRTRINQIINKSDNQSMLQDSIVTVRDGRFVIPVKQEHKGKFPGIVHDQSASGATLFIEPQVIVNLNNDLRELEIAEKIEIDRILLELSGRVGEYSEELKNNQEILVQMDLIMAKGKLASIQGAECPKINDKGIVSLKSARHPLIDKTKVVPIDVEVGSKYNSLIITGPNTGGKTVTLKTVGLLAMMAQTGLHIPASSMSTLPIFKDIFADIGDEQSIEQSLSTFSSHMKNIVDIVSNVEKDTLILLDELGAGTDPTEGAALAISILEKLYEKQGTIIATTHYTELKKYALSKEGVSNASMEFDVETLSPTYKLTIGIPGRSNAFEISKKLGLIPEIIEKAKMLLDGGDIAFEEVLTAIEADKKAAEQERDEAIMLNIEMKKQKEIFERESAKAREKQEKLLAQAKEEARDIIEEAKRITKSVQEELKELSKVESLGERNKRLDRSKRKVKDAAGRYKETFIVEENDNPINVDEIKIGDRVKVLTLAQNGEVIGLPDKKGEIQVQIGIMKIKCKPEDLKLIIDGKNKIKKKPERAMYGSMYKAKTMSISTTIDVKGQNLDEALNNVDKYLDDAFIANLSEITIIHGRGEGILMKGIHNMLKSHKHAKGFRKGNYNEGGDGVTIVKIK
ncbi:MAG: endonuclease MutS2 [Anaerovoracaceae bacterium]